MIRDLVVELFEAALARGAAAGRWPAQRVAFSVEPPRDRGACTVRRWGV